MRYALILAGGAGTRLWPMSRGDLPKQLIPFVAGKSLLEISFERLKGLVPPHAIRVCAALHHKEATLSALPALRPEHFVGEPTGRDTLNAVGLGASVLAQEDPEAVIGVFTADHVIEPQHEFREIVRSGYELVEKAPRTLVTFGITPSEPSTAYGYLELGDPLAGTGSVLGCPRRVARFHEKPDRGTAEGYVAAGLDRFLWNSGMFVWRASTLLDCVRRYEPQNFEGLRRIARAWNTSHREEVVQEIYPDLRRVSVDYAVMEPASRDTGVQVAAIPMSLRWLDVGSWPSFARICSTDEHGNALGAERHILHDTSGTVVASSDPKHLIAAVGCRDLIVIHTPDATLVCPATDAEAIKEIHALVRDRFGDELV